MVRIVTASLDIQWKKKDKNRENCARIFEFTSNREVDLLVFPETTLTGFTFEAELAETEGQSESVDFFQRLARRYRVSVLFGAILKNDIGKFYNTSILLNKTGDVVGTYKKIHPFSFAGESEFISAGNTVHVLSAGDLRVGTAICYDLRFPRMFSEMAYAANLITVISNWPERRIQHWTTLLRARSIENQLFVLGVNRTGIDGNNIRYPKSSILFGPDGREIEPVEGVKDLEVEVYELNINDVEQYRHEFPAFLDRIKNFD